jgi:hypothetical protein
MSAAARPKRWVVFRQAQGRELGSISRLFDQDRFFDPTLNGAYYKGIWGKRGDLG